VKLRIVNEREKKWKNNEIKEKSWNGSMTLERLSILSRMRGCVCVYKV